MSPRCAPVFVIAAPGQALPTLQAEILRDEVRGVGPLLATAAGCARPPRPALELAFVCAVDMPLLSADLIDELAGPAVRLGADVVLPWDGRDHYLAGIYRTACTNGCPNSSRRANAACARWSTASTHNGSSCPSSRR